MVATDTVGKQKSAWLWDLATGRRIKQLGPWGPESSLNFCAGGQSLLTKLSQKEDESPYDLWNAVSGERRINDFGKDARVALSLDGNRLYELANGDVKLYDALDGTFVANVTQWPGSVRHAVFGPAGQLATIEDRSDTFQAIYLWDTFAGAAHGMLNHDGIVDEVVFSPEGGLIATISREPVNSTDASSVRLWRTDTGLLTGLLTPSQTVRTVQFSPDGTRIVPLFRGVRCQPMEYSNTPSDG